jgi:hypothetical protein
MRVHDIQQLRAGIKANAVAIVKCESEGLPQITRVCPKDAKSSIVIADSDFSVIGPIVDGMRLLEPPNAVEDGARAKIEDFESLPVFGGQEQSPVLPIDREVIEAACDARKRDRPHKLERRLGFWPGYNRANYPGDK